jgi:hypothetical protein
LPSLSNSKESYIFPCHAEQSRSEPSRAEARWLLRNNKQLSVALLSNACKHGVYVTGKQCEFPLFD